MVQFALIWVGLLFLGVVLFPLSVGIFPIPAAVLVARNRWKQTVAVLVTAGLTPIFSVLLYLLVETLTSSADAPGTGMTQPVRYATGKTLEYIAFGFAGVIAGMGFARLWSYGRLVHVLTAYVFALMGVSILISYGAWTSQVDAMAETFRTMVRQQAEEAGTSAVQTQLDLIAWAEEHAGSLVLGVNYAAIFVASCLFVSLTRFILRTRYGEAGPIGSFTRMRPSEWLVWLAIASALLCLAHQQWPRPELRFVGWNSALGLSAIYCINGLSVFLYGVHVFRPNLLIFALIVFVLINIGAVPLLILIGLFDTWGDYRRKIDMLVAARAKRKGPDDNGMV